MSIYKASIAKDNTEAHDFVNAVCGDEAMRVCKKEEDMLGVEDLFKVKARPVDFGVDL